MLDLFAALSQSLEEGRRAVLATILSSAGSAPRGAGAWMLVSEGGRPLGTIGGGAVEYEAIRLAEELLRSGGSCRRRYVLTNGQAADLGMICGGQVEVLFQYVAPDRKSELLPVLAEAAERTRSGEKAWLVTALEGGDWRWGLYGASGSPFPDGAAADRLKALADWRCRFEEGAPALLVQPLCPGGTVYLFGAGHVGRALAHMLTLTDFRVLVYDQRRESLDQTFFPDGAELRWGPFSGALEHLPPLTAEDYAVIMTPGHQGDYEILVQVLTTPARYIGCIGSRKKVAVTRERLLADGFTEADIRRIHAPIGLDIGGETPAEVAVSVTAQLIACRWGRPTRREDRA